MSGFDIPGHLTMQAAKLRGQLARLATLDHPGNTFTRLAAIASVDTGHPATSDEAVDVACLYEAALEWFSGGRQRFRISDSLAALFRLTSAPDVDTDSLPHGSFLLEVPADYLPLRREDGAPSLASWVLFSSSATEDEGRVVFYGAFADDGSGFTRRGGCGRMVASEVEGPLGGTTSPEAKLAARFVGNLIAFLLEFPSAKNDAARPARGGGLTPGPVMVRPPLNVTVTREMREAARGAASSVSIGGIRRAMAHFVRGHWRNQPVGEGRKDIRRTWVKPHKRGDEAFGRVVERITKVTGGENR